MDPAISSGQWESHPAIDPANGDLWFVRSNPDFSGWALYRSPCNNGHWDTASTAPISHAGLEADPWFTPDGNTLYYISTRASDRNSSSALDIWRSQRLNGAWLTPERLPAPVNSDAAEWFPRLAQDGWLYFGSGRGGGLGNTDIWRARQRDGNWVTENLGPDVNTAAHEYEFEISRDGNHAVLATDTGLFLLTKRHNRWTDKRALPGTTTSDVGPVFLADNRAFLLSRDVGGSRSGELVIAQLRPTRPEDDQAASMSCLRSAIALGSDK